VTRRLDEVLRLSPVAPFVAAMRATPA
jgi:hypothetical protein